MRVPFSSKREQPPRVGKKGRVKRKARCRAPQSFHSTQEKLCLVKDTTLLRSAVLSARAQEQREPCTDGQGRGESETGHRQPEARRSRGLCGRDCRRGGLRIDVARESCGI